MQSVKSALAIVGFGLGSLLAACATVGTEPRVVYGSGPPTGVVEGIDDDGGFKAAGFCRPVTSIASVWLILAPRASLPTDHCLTIRLPYGMTSNASIRIQKSLESGFLSITSIVNV